MKKNDSFLREYVGRLSDTDLRVLHSYLNQRLQDDLSEAVIFLSQTNEIDRWLASAKSCNDFFDQVDMLGKQVHREQDRRNSR